MPLQIRRGTTPERLSITPLVGEPVFDTDLNQIFVGDGITAGGVSPDVAAETVEQALDTVGAALVNGVHQNISFTYGTVQDAANRIDATVSVATLLENLDLNEFDIVGTGNINIDGNIVGNIKGSVFADDSTLLVDGTNGTIPWAVISDAPAFLTEVPGSITADVTGSVFADNSTLLVDGTNGEIVGPVNTSSVKTDAISSINDNLLTISNGDPTSSESTVVNITTVTGSRADLRLTRIDESADLSVAETPYGRISFEKTDINGTGASSIIFGGSDFLLFANRESTVGNVFPDEGSFVIKNYGNFGVGTRTPTVNARIDINGIMKLRLQTAAPSVGEAGMVAVADGNTAGWDPKGTNLGVPYPVFYNGSAWVPFF